MYGVWFLVLGRLWKIFMIVDVVLGEWVVGCCKVKDYKCLGGLVVEKVGNVGVNGKICG